MQSIIDFLQKETIPFETDMDLSRKTWIKRGGVARVWVQPTVLADFQKLARWCQQKEIPFEVIGNTSNCYFQKDYNPLLVISTLKLTEMRVEGDSITCDCGYNMSKLAKYCNHAGIAGFEGFIGLPGTVGGAAVNNAGCYGSLISQVVHSVVLLQAGEVKTLSNQQMAYRHRNSAIKSKEIKGVVLSVVFKIGAKENPEVLEQRADAYQWERKTFQEHSYPNLGSTFCVVDLKKLPFHIRCISGVTQRLLNIAIRDPLRKQKLTTKLFLKVRGAGAFSKYISEYSVGCFTWKDEGADQAFHEYVAFMKGITHKAVVEIEIKDGR